MQLILEKITSPPSLTHLARPRLTSILQQSLANCTATLIVGRAGSGKTTLAADFSASCDRATAWYRVDAPDSELEIFFQYFVITIQQQCVEFGIESLNELKLRDRNMEAPLLAEALIYRLLETEHQPLLIIIEDLHLIYDAPWLVPFFSRLLPLVPADVHLIITSRTMPPAPLWRMRSKQSLCVIEEWELAFTRQEAIELFESRGLSHEQAILAMKQCRGRALALSLLAGAQTRNNDFNNAWGPGCDRRQGA